MVARANDSIYGLVAAVYTSDVDKAMYLSKKVKAGTVWINTYNVISPQTPWGIPPPPLPTVRVERRVIN